MALLRVACGFSGTESRGATDGCRRRSIYRRWQTHLGDGPQRKLATMSDSAHPRKRWIDAWLHSDLIGFPVTLAAVAIAAISVGLFVVIGGAGGLFVGKLLFIFGLGGLVGLILLLEGRRGETTEAVATAAPASDGRERVLVVANEGLESAALCEEVCARGNGGGAETMIVAPVVASSALRALGGRCRRGVARGAGSSRCGDRGSPARRGPRNGSR